MNRSYTYSIMRNKIEIGKFIMLRPLLGRFFVIPDNNKSITFPISFLCEDYGDYFIYRPTIDATRKSNRQISLLLEHSRKKE